MQYRKTEEVGADPLSHSHVVQEVGVDPLSHSHAVQEVGVERREKRPNFLYCTQVREMVQLTRLSSEALLHVYKVCEQV